MCEILHVLLSNMFFNVMILLWIAKHAQCKKPLYKMGQKGHTWLGRCQHMLVISEVLPAYIHEMCLSLIPSMLILDEGSTCLQLSTSRYTFSIVWCNMHIPNVHAYATVSLLSYLQLIILVINTYMFWTYVCVYIYTYLYVCMYNYNQLNISIYILYIYASSNLSVYIQINHTFSVLSLNYNPLL